MIKKKKHFIILKVVKLYNFVIQMKKSTSTKIVHLADEDKKDERKIIVIMEKARLETAVIKK